MSILCAVKAPVCLNGPGHLGQQQRSRGCMTHQAAMQILDGSAIKGQAA